MFSPKETGSLPLRANVAGSDLQGFPRLLGTWPFHGATDVRSSDELSHEDADLLFVVPNLCRAPQKIHFAHLKHDVCPHTGKPPLTRQCSGV